MHTQIAWRLHIARVAKPVRLLARQKNLGQTARQLWLQQQLGLALAVLRCCGLPANLDCVPKHNYHALRFCPNLASLYSGDLRECLHTGRTCRTAWSKPETHHTHWHQDLWLINVHWARDVVPTSWPIRVDLGIWYDGMTCDLIGQWVRDWT